jgi:hypothetical protein
MGAEAEIEGFIARYEPAIAQQVREARRRMRARLPGAVELVYDNYNALAIAYASSERAADIVFSIAAYPRWISLFFARGVDLQDPNGLLKGSGSKIRHIVLDTPARLDAPEVAALIAQAAGRAERPFDPAGPGKALVKSISVKQRPRRP